MAEVSKGFLYWLFGVAGSVLMTFYGLSLIGVIVTEKDPGAAFIGGTVVCGIPGVLCFFLAKRFKKVPHTTHKLEEEPPIDYDPHNVVVHYEKALTFARTAQAGSESINALQQISDELNAVIQFGHYNLIEPVRALREIVQTNDQARADAMLNMMKQKLPNLIREIKKQI